MGDRRISDRRSPEEGVFKIEKQKMIIYLIVGLIIIALIISTVVLGALYISSQNKYRTIVNELDYSNSVRNEIAENESRGAYNCELSIIGDKPQIKSGETITYELNVKNIKADAGILMFDALLDYDSDLFDCEIVVDENSEWTKTSLLEDSLTLSRNDLMPSTENQTIAKLVVKSKENIEEGQYTINLIDLKFTIQNDKTFSVPDEIIDINVLNS